MSFRDRANRALSRTAANQSLPAPVSTSSEVDMEIHGGFSGDFPDEYYQPSEKIVYRDREDVLKPYKDGEFSYRRCVLSPTQLLMPDDLSPDEWEEIGRILFSLEGSLAWHIGDWLNRGEVMKWGQTYQKLAADLDLNVDTLYIYAHVARKVLIRNQDLSFGHHRLVAKLEPEEQRKWLIQAVNQQWTVGEMKKAMRKLPEAADELRHFLRRVDTEIQQLSERYGARTAEERLEVAARLRALADLLEQADAIERGD